MLDPGHIQQSHTVTDTTGLIDEDYPNHPELEDVWAVANMVKDQLTSAGYQVIMTKDNVDGTVKKADGSFTYVTLRDRANVANNQHAALAVSIHDDGSQAFSNQNAIIFAQAAGQYRQVPSTGQKVPLFANTQAIAASQSAAQKMGQDRSAAEGHPVLYTTDATQYIGTRLPSPGSIWMVQLFSTVPWVYNEAGGYSDPNNKAAGLNAGDKAKYASGIVKGVEDAVPISKGTATNPGCGTPGSAAGGPGKIVAQAEYLAWPQVGHHAAKSDATPPPKYQQVMPATDGFTSDAGDDFPFSDCGVFVSTVLRSSGVDPNYPKRGTDTQLPYLEKTTNLYQRVLVNGKDPSNTGALQPGDILITTGGVGHTYLYTGNWGDGNAYNSASASWHGHVPEATDFYQDIDGQHFAVFRIVGAPAAAPTVQ